MSRNVVRAVGAQRMLAVLLGFGALVRLVASIVDPPLHPDEYFQYLEPAWWHLTGSGVSAWEWREGLRSWVLPFYNGCWMALAMTLGVRRGATLGLLLKVHWALINSSLIVLAYRGGGAIARRLTSSQRASYSDERALGHQGGLVAAALCAGFALLVAYSAHTLSEMPSMLCLVAGLVLTAELCEEPEERAPRLFGKAALAGALLSLSACLRIASGPLVLVAPLWLFVTARFRLLAALLAAALLPALLFASVDRITWGGFASSYVAYLRFNFIEGGAARFGTEGPKWYLETIVQRLPWMLAPLGALALVGVRATWPYLLSATILLSYLSTQPHKEERFIIVFWPLLLIAAGGTLGALIARARASSVEPLDVAREQGSVARLKRHLPLTLSVMVVLLVWADGLRSYLGTHNMLEPNVWLKEERMNAQAWAGAQPDATGLMVDQPYHTGAGLWFGNKGPQVPFRAELFKNPIVSHILVPTGSNSERMALGAGFAVVHREGEFVVLGRRRGAERRPDRATR